MTPHCHDYFQLVYIVDGAANYEIAGQEYAVDVGSLLFFLPYQEHRLKQVSQGTVKTLDLKFQIHDVFLRQEMMNVEPTLRLEHGDPSKIFLKIRNEGIERRPQFKAITTSYLVELLVLIIQQSQLNQLAVKSNQSTAVGASGQSGAAIVNSGHVATRVKEFIRAHIHEELTIPDIAQALGYHPNYLGHAFKQATGITPIRFLYQCRVEKACELIRFSDYGLKEITVLAGFKTVQHFTRCFHEITGVSPGHWRTKEREGVGKGVFINETFTNSNFFQQQAEWEVYAGD